MTPEINILQQQMKGSPLAAYYMNQVVSGLSADTAQAFTDTMQTHLARYAELPEIRKQTDSSMDFTVQLRAVLNDVPPFIFLLANDLNRLPDGYQPARGLVLVGIFFVMQRTQSHRTHILLLIESLQQNESLELINDPSPDKPLRTLLEVVYHDALSIAANQIKFQLTKNSLELIEILFCFSGMSQVFLKYYFDLLAESKNDRLSRKVNLIFSKLFLMLRLEEIRYWKGYKNSEVIKNRLQAMITANSPKMRHPKLQKDVFSALANYNPIIHSGSSRMMTVSIQSVLKGQLTFFHSFTIPQMTLMMNIVQRFKGDPYSVYLLSQVIKTNKDRLLELYNYIEKSQQKSYDSLLTIVRSLVQRFFPDEKIADPTPPKKKERPVVEEIKPSARHAAAKRNLAVQKKRKGMMTHDKVAEYLKERLKKLYEKVKQTGAMTQDMIPEYLAKFATAAENFLTEVSPTRQKELVQAFEESTDEILDEITRFSEMKNEELQEIRTGIHEKIAELDTDDLEQRTEVVEQIGMTLADVSEKAAPPVDKGIDAKAMLKNEQIAIGFDEKAPFVPLGEFFKLPFGDRKGPAEEDWFGYHRRYMELAVENKKLEPSILEALPVLIAFLPKLKYRKYFNIFPNDEYEDPTCSAVYDIWKSSALERLRVE